MRKKHLLFMTSAITALMLTGCAQGAQEDTAPVEAAETIINEEKPGVPTAASAEAVETEEEEDAVLKVKDVTESNWMVVAKTEMFKDSNFEGFMNENFGISVGYAGAVSYTEDGGKTWTEGENSSLCRFCLDIVDENLAWCGGNGNNVRVTKDGGKTWSEVSDAKLSTTHLSIDFLDDTTGWVSTTKKCAATNDGGTTWTELTLPDEIDDIAAVAIRSKADGYVLANNGLFFITNDGGATWTSKDIHLADYNVVNEKGETALYKYKTAIADMNFYDEKNGMLVFSGLVKGEGTKVWCLTTEDGGDSWTSEEIPVSEGFSVNKVFLSSDGNYITLGDAKKNVEVLARQ